MEIRLFCAYISCCVLLLTYLEAKTVSLNDIIAAERAAAAQHTTRRSTLLNTLAGTAIPAYGRKTSPLKHRQTYQIASPSKPRNFNIIQKSRLRRKNLSKKREISHNEGIIQKYIPLLKNIRLLVDNILTTESSETDEPTENKYQRNLLRANDRDGVVCTCGRKSNSGFTLRPQEKAITATPAAATEIQNTIVTIGTTTQAYSAVNDNVRRIGRNKIVPVLSKRNPTGIRGNNSGFGQRGGSTYNGSFEGYITGNNGNNEHNTRQETRPHTENYEEHTDSYSRNDAGRDRSSERLRGIGVESRVTEPNRETGEVEESTLPGSETFEGLTRNLYEHERETEYKIRRDETESSLSVPELGSRLRGFDSQEKDTAIRSTELSDQSVTENSASDKRFFDRSGSFTSENQGVSAANEAVAPKHILPNSTYPVGKVVMIFDGYSVAKDANGANKLTEKAIQIHT